MNSIGTSQYWNFTVSELHSIRTSKYLNLIASEGLLELVEFSVNL